MRRGSFSIGFLIGFVATVANASLVLVSRDGLAGIPVADYPIAYVPTLLLAVCVGAVTGVTTYFMARQRR